MEAGLNKRQIFEHVGHMNQMAGAKRYILQEGRMQGVHAADLWNGAGLSLTVLSDRASDIYALTYKGQSLCWLSDVGVSSPAFSHIGDFEWEKNFSGGMLVTCGLTTAGLPSVDEGEALYLHGDISNTPSEEVACRTYWQGDDYFIEYSAKTYQSKPYGENLCLSRVITLKMGDDSVRVRDRVENLGMKPAPLMVLYHMNFGYPLLDENARLYVTKGECVPTSPWAAASLNQLETISKPDEEYRARAYNCTVKADEDGYGYASVLNPALNLGATIRFGADTLNRFNLWKCLQKRSYVVGLEPCNCRTWGRAKERETNGLTLLKPMESREMELELRVHSGAEALAAAARRYKD